MKKILPLIALSALALVACKKGTVSGTVIDPFSGNAIESPTVYIKGTVHTSQNQKKFPKGLPDGKFQFEGIEPGTYTLEAGKGKYSKGRAEFVISKESMEVTQNVYIYGQEVNPGLYRPIEGSNAEKITSDWASWQATCKKNGFAMRTKFETEIMNQTTKKKEKKESVLPGPKDVPMEIAALYKITSSVSSPVEAISYPILTSNAKNEDCSEIGEKENLLVPDKSRGTVLSSGYKSDNLYEIKGTLLNGKQLLALSQDGKLVGLYYLDVK
jgi:hypothetical protein